MTDVSYNNIRALNTIAYNKLESNYSSSKTVFDMALSGAYGVNVFADTINYSLVF